MNSPRIFLDRTASDDEPTRHLQDRPRLPTIYSSFHHRLCSSEKKEENSMPTKAVDEAFEAFERLFGYKWGTTFGLDADPSGAKNTKTDTTYSTTTKRKLTQIFGEERAARILGTKGNHTKKRRKLESLATSIENFKDLVLPVLQQETTVETQVFAGQTIQTTKKKAAGTASKTIKSCLLYTSPSPRD